MRGKKYDATLREQVCALRRAGKTYGEIIQNTGLPIPKSTLSDWCSGILLSQMEQEGLQTHANERVARGRLIALSVNRSRRKIYLASVEKRVAHLADFVQGSRDAAKVAIAMLYLGEGSKAGAFMFGNSNPRVVRLFLYLLRRSYTIDERKFRCTVQCRADQDTKALEQFWSVLTGISPRQFYLARIDLRTVGKPTRKPDYKGVCRLEYLSADLYFEIMKAGECIMRLGL